MEDQQRRPPESRHLRRAAAVLSLVAIAPIVASAAALGIAWLAARQPGIAALIPPAPLPTDTQSILLFVLPTFGVIGIPLLCLLFEAGMLGFERSALRRLLFGKSRSADNDLFYFLLRGFGLANAFAFLLSFGSVYWIADQIHRVCELGILRDAPFLAQLLGVVLVNSFVFYWAHRLMHTASLWEIHKVHHSALEMNVITPTRNHPIDMVVMTVLYSGPVAVLGASVGAVFAYQAGNAVYQCLVHSGLHFRSRWLEALVITPNAHRLHHSNSPHHWGKNFGIVTLWDRLFGTYLAPDEDPAAFGVEGLERHNTGRPFRELWSTLLYWLDHLQTKSAETDRVL